jgi:hypothetical protein
MAGGCSRPRGQRNLPPLAIDGPHTVKVLDFGLVRHTGGLLGDETRLTKLGSTTGTPAYMSPEMALAHVREAPQRPSERTELPIPAELEELVGRDMAVGSHDPCRTGREPAASHRSRRL